MNLNKTPKLIPIKETTYHVNAVVRELYICMNIASPRQGRLRIALDLCTTHPLGLLQNIMTGMPHFLALLRYYIFVVCLKIKGLWKAHILQVHWHHSL